MHPGDSTEFISRKPNASTNGRTRVVSSIPVADPQARAAHEGT